LAGNKERTLSHIILIFRYFCFQRVLVTRMRTASVSIMVPGPHRWRGADADLVGAGQDLSMVFSVCFDEPGALEILSSRLEVPVE